MKARIEPGYWDDPDLEEWDQNQLYLYLYLISNKHVGVLGLYQVTIRKMSFETRIPAEVIGETLQRLKGKVMWDPETSTVWVKGFLRRQFPGSKVPHRNMVKAILNAVDDACCRSMPFAADLVEQNLALLRRFQSGLEAQGNRFPSASEALGKLCIEEGEGEGEGKEKGSLPKLLESASEALGDGEYSSRTIEHLATVFRSTRDGTVEPSLRNFNEKVISERLRDGLWTAKEINAYFRKHRQLDKIHIVLPAVPPSVKSKIAEVIRKIILYVDEEGLVKALLQLPDCTWNEIHKAYKARWKGADSERFWDKAVTIAQAKRRRVKYPS